ncbi:MAG: PIN domain-containing protein, partial [Bacteroidota bacterium]
FLHRDPFDRLIIAQAISDKLTIITKDEYIAKYDVKTFW